MLTLTEKNKASELLKKHGFLEQGTLFMYKNTTKTHRIYISFFWKGKIEINSQNKYVGEWLNDSEVPTVSFIDYNVFEQYVLKHFC